MSESKHTPGPWIQNRRWVGVPNHRSMICECRDVNGNWADDTMSLSNARLIACAPELLNAAKNLIIIHSDSNRYDERALAFKTLDDAIAKAEGRL